MLNRRLWDGATTDYLNKQLLFAVIHGDQAAANELIRRGADILHENQNGTSALEFAAINSHLDIILSPFFTDDKTFDKPQIVAAGLKIAAQWDDTQTANEILQRRGSSREVENMARRLLEGNECHTNGNTRNLLLAWVTHKDIESALQANDSHAQNNQTGRRQRKSSQIL